LQVFQKDGSNSQKHYVCVGKEVFQMLVNHGHARRHCNPKDRFQAPGYSMLPFASSAVSIVSDNPSKANLVFFAKVGIDKFSLLVTICMFATHRAIYDTRVHGHGTLSSNLKATLGLVFWRRVTAPKLCQDFF